MVNYIHLNIPITVEQVEKLSKVVAITTASRDKNETNERITKATFIRVLIDEAPLEDAEYRDVRTEIDLKERLTGCFSKAEKEQKRIDPALLASIYKKFANDDNRKWVAGDFINSLFENGLIEAQSSEELWAKLLKNPE
jgi:hypothetical protein